MAPPLHPSPEGEGEIDRQPVPPPRRPEIRAFPGDSPPYKASVMSEEQRDRPASGRFEGGVHLFPVRVYFEDTDLSGIVYHANYLRFMERARSDMLRLAGIDQRAAMEAGEGAYAVVDLAIKFRSPARLEDDLVVESTVEEIRAASCVIHQRVRQGTRILTEATVQAALVSDQGRPLRQPRVWVETFKRLKEGENLTP